MYTFDVTSNFYFYYNVAVYFFYLVTLTITYMYYGTYNQNVILIQVCA